VTAATASTATVTGAATRSPSLRRFALSGDATVLSCGSCGATPLQPPYYVDDSAAVPTALCSWCYAGNAGNTRLSFQRVEASGRAGPVLRPRIDSASDVRLCGALSCCCNLAPVPAVLLSLPAVVHVV
jgi:hypothetical protein